MTRLTLDYDGNLRSYSLIVTSSNWLVTWMAFRRVCDMHELCEKNSLCKYIPKLECACLEGFQVVDASNWSKGCRRKANIMPTQDFAFRKLARTDFYGYDFAYAEHVPILERRCVCLDNADCQASAYRQREGKCYPKVYPFSGKTFPDPYNDIYMTVPKGALPSSALTPTLTHICNFHVKEANTSSQMFMDGSYKFKFGYFLSSALTLLFI
ncbi:hypothetical protein QYE76_028432 [Lolium multiflorum]|uniref:S-locus glycoprotein domain-containing protein n=1 Tax=Lolium multiflorum TaxID=4521 RepID=A0AAD8VFS5_LOLMU|nr:hypothetical protein QYE76_028432 [Lolium multiflorum]